MAIDFSNVNNASNISKARDIAAEQPGIFEVIPLRDGYISKGVYDSAVRRGKESELVNIQPTELTASLAGLGACLLGMLCRTGQVDIDTAQQAGIVAVSILSRDSTTEEYAGYRDACLNVPDDYPEQAMRVLFAMEVIEICLDSLEDLLNGPAAGEQIH